MKRIVLHISRVTKVALVSLIVLVAVVMSAARLMLPMVSDFREQVESQLSAIVGTRVHLGELSGSVVNFNPAVEVSDLIIYQAQNPDAPSLTLSDIVLELDTVSSLTHWQPIFRRVSFGGGRLMLDGKSGAISPTGFPTTSEPPKEPVVTSNRTDFRGLLDFIGQQRRLDFSHFQFVFALPSGENREVAVRRIVVSGPPESRKLAAVVDTAAGQEIDLTLHLAGRAYSWPDVVLGGYISVPPVDLKPWLPLLPDALKNDEGLRINELRSGAELWFSYTPQEWDFRGHVRADEIDVDWKGESLPPLTSLRSDVALTFSHETAPKLWLNDLSFIFARVPYPESNMYMEWQRKDDHDITLAVDRVFLQPLALSVRTSKQVPKLVDELFSRLAPRGRLGNFVMRMYPDRKPFDFDLAADIQNVGVDHWYGAPSGERVTGSVRMNSDSGVIDVSSSRFTLGLENVFDDVWGFDRVAGRLYWRIVDGVYVLRSDGLSLHGGEGDIRTRLRLDIPFDENQSIWMALEAGITNGDIAYAGKYLPTKGAMSDDLATWLNGAIKGGDVRDGAFIWNGPLTGSHVENSLSWGLFFDVTNTGFAFDVNWPELTDIDGLVSVDQDEVWVQANEAKIYNTQLTGMTARVPELLGNNPLMLNVKGQAITDGKDGLRILQETPIASAMNHVADNWDMTGKLDVGLDLDIPLSSKGPEGDYRVGVKLNNNTFTLKDAEITGSQLNGEVSYSAKGLFSQGLTGDILGHPAAIDLSTKVFGQSQTTLVDVKSRISMDALSKWLKQDFFGLAVGTTDYQAKISIGSSVKVNVASDLQGVATTLPAPLHKTAKEKESLKVNFDIHKGQSVNIKADLSRKVSTDLALDKKGLLLGIGAHFGVGKPVAPKKGVLVTGQLDELKLQPWVQWWDNSPFVGKSTAETKEGASSANKSKRPIELFSVIEVKDFGIQHLYWNGSDEIFPDAVANISRQGNGWDIRLTTPTLDGTASVPGDNAPLMLDIHRLDLPASLLPEHKMETGEQGNAVVAPSRKDDNDPLLDSDPASLPDMNVNIHNIRIGGDEFGHLIFHSRAVKHGVQVNGIRGELGNGAVDGSLAWLLKDKLHSTTVSTDFSSKDVGRMLESWGYPGLLEAKKLNGHANMTWQGSPADFDVDDLAGDLTLAIRDGSFLSVDTASTTGALRLFGVLNLDSITRRLRLDFSDLFSSGMAFDSIDGQLNFDNGLISFSEPVTVKGPATDFRLGGQLYVPDRSMSMDLIVTLPVTQNISTVSLLLGQPYIAGAAYLFDKLLGSTISQFASLRYEIEGSFSEPEVKLDRLFSNKVKSDKRKSSKKE